MPKLSFVIRAYNEADRLERLLSFLRQHAPNEEVVVVDNGSADETAKVIKKYGAVNVFLAQEEFNYPKSLNAGITAASGEIIVIMSAHCLPVRADLSKVILRHFKDPRVAGVYGPNIPEQDSPLFERLVTLPFVLKAKLLTKPSRVTKDCIGLLGGTNCAIRRSLWEEHAFDEAYGAGGEDGEWGRWALAGGYMLIYDPQFMVRHSHYLTVPKFIKQHRLWRTFGGPRPFEVSDLSFRDDIKRS